MGAHGVSGLAALLVTIGAVLLLSPPMAVLSARLGLPRVSLMIGLGVAVGPLGLDLMPGDSHAWHPVVAQIALSMVGFVLGGEFTLDNLRSRGVAVLRLSAAVTAATFATVAAGLTLVVGVPLAASLVLASAATATDPAACKSVIDDTGADSSYSRLILGEVAVDDVWGILTFAGVLTVVGSLLGHGEGTPLLTALWEVGGSLGLGVLLGVPMATLTGRLKPGEPTREEALGFVLLCAGVATWLEVPYLLSTVVLGAVVANLATHHEVPFREVEGIEWPFLAVFYVLSGAMARVDDPWAVLPVVAGYAVLRMLGRQVGALVGLSNRRLAPWMGLSLLPQAGVALGTTLVAVSRFPELGDDVLSAVVLATVFFELVGPVLLRLGLARMAD